MKISLSIQNNNSNAPKKHRVNFGAGLTPKMIQEIERTDVLEISKKLAKKGIPSDFKDNKVIAWCCDKTVEIFEQLNQRFGAKLALPKGIYVKDFAEFNVQKKSLAAFCNLAPNNLMKNSNDEIPAKTLFFNTFETALIDANPKIRWLYNWDNIDEIADANYLIGHSSTDHFLGTFIQEASHNAHLVRALKKIGGATLKAKIELFSNEQIIDEYQHKYGNKLMQISRYALTNPLEAVACDMSKIIADSLDKETLMPTRNPFISTPYEKLSFMQRVNIPNYSDKERPLNEILRHFWNGKFG